jgi:hypothetical protein
MLNTLLLAAALVCTIVSEPQRSGDSYVDFPTRLSGTWKSETHAANRLGPKTGVLASNDLLTFKHSTSWNEMKPAFVDRQLVDAPLHIGGVTIDNDADALFVLRGRIGFNEIGTTPGGGGVETVRWEPLHLIQGDHPDRDMLVIGRTIYKRQP